MESISDLVRSGEWISVGVVSSKELTHLYSRASCLVFPSIYEGFGLPPLEALSYGTPCVVSSIDTHKEILDDAVLYCDPEDPESLALQLELVLYDSDTRDSLIRLGRSHAETFQWSRTVEETISVYEKVW